MEPSTLTSDINVRYARLCGRCGKAYGEHYGAGDNAFCNPGPVGAGGYQFVEQVTPDVESPAKPHPLQRVATMPGGFGQSLWRPWELPCP